MMWRTFLIFIMQENRILLQLSNIQDQINIISEKLYNPQLTGSEVRELSKKKKKLKKKPENRSARREVAGSSKWCSICQTNSHDEKDCKKVYCDICKKYGFHRTQDCYHNKKYENAKGKWDKGKSKAKGKGGK